MVVTHFMQTICGSKRFRSNLTWQNFSARPTLQFSVSAWIEWTNLPESLTFPHSRHIRFISNFSSTRDNIKSPLGFWAATICKQLMKTRRKFSSIWRKRVFVDCLQALTRWFNDFMKLIDVKCYWMKIKTHNVAILFLKHSFVSDNSEDIARIPEWWSSWSPESRFCSPSTLLYWFQVAREDRWLVLLLLAANNHNRAHNELFEKFTDNSDAKINFTHSNVRSKNIAGNISKDLKELNNGKQSLIPKVTVKYATEFLSFSG